MAFINEYIPESDYGKHDLRRVCMAHNLRWRQDHMHSEQWTIDRERDIFLIKVWSHHESDFSGWAFCWKGHWIFFEMRIHDSSTDLPTKTCWVGYQIKDFSLPEVLLEFKEEVIADLNQALADYCGGGVFSPYTHGTATIEFI